MVSAPSFLINAVRAFSRGLVFAAEGFRDDRDGLRDIVNAMELPMSVCGCDWSYRWVSKGIGRLLGRRAEDVIGRPIVEVIGKEAFESLKPYFERVLAGEYVEYEEQVFYKALGWRWIHAMYAPTFGPDRTPDGWVALILDIDEQRKAQEIAIESEDRFRKLADNAPIAMWITGADGRSTFVNAYYVAYTGLSEPEIREHWDASIHPEERETFVAAYLQALQRRAELHEVVRLRRHDGVYRWFEVIGVPRYEAARFVGYTGCGFDITDRKIAEDAAREENRQKDQFIAVLGHELRNPMGAISNAVGILERVEMRNDDARRAIKVTRRQLDNLARLTDDVFAVGSLIAGNVTLARQPLDLGAVVRFTIQMLQTSAASRSIAIGITTQPAWVYADPVRLEQIVRNLVGNAVKFTPEQGRIDVRVSATDARAVLTVSDSGIGIPKEFLPRLFQPFAQAHPEFSGESRGLGLGLALTRRLVELHGGKISVESGGPGHGSTFVVSLPLMSQPLGAAAGQAANETKVNLQILVIEDNEDYRESLRDLLSIEGCIVETASDGPEAMELALAHSPDVALIDLALPTWDGYEVARRLREKFDSAIRILALTGFSREGDKTAARAAGFDDFLVKPVAPSRLLEALRPR